ncbi:MAG: hypothetical protein GY910_16165 [bacterium]|nr:hypothetical protein [Deltaproteobacteria bacterium]MCP4906510.1 hypothetical protein [bacterium]
MPHYTDYNGGRFAEIPPGGGEFWGSVDTENGLIAASMTLDWTTYESNSIPAVLSPVPNEAYWQGNQFPLPEVFAVMVDNSFTNANNTDFRVWDVAWNPNGVGVPSPRPETVSFQELLDEANDPLAPPHAAEQVYFQVNSLPPLAAPALGLTGALGLSVALLGLVFFISLRRKWSKDTAATAP